MEVNKDYIVAVKGVLYFESGKHVKNGGFIPKDTPEKEIKEKLKRCLIVEFDEKIAAAAQMAATGNGSAYKDLENKIKILEKENLDLKIQIEENDELKKHHDELAKENDQLKKDLEALKKGDKK